MDSLQTIIAIYSYLWHEEARLDHDREECSLYATDNSASTNCTRNYYEARLKFDYFREFSRKIFEILRYYEP